MRLPERFEDGLGYLIHHLLYAFRQGFSRECARLGINVTLEDALFPENDVIRKIVYFAF